ncbi:MAG: hypothetical protein H6624_14315 [Bdellovibrionaceae bacterium]|nr:hypothetical protein [Bdellovibrionales bacterium]MCB9085517.1 hypothetical protein [Pseudobdellovibrionaceae bacterium]
MVLMPMFPRGTRHYHPPMAFASFYPRTGQSDGKFSPESPITRSALEAKYQSANTRIIVTSPIKQATRLDSIHCSVLLERF